ncbi:MAG: hypothetical protein MR297_02385 [Tenericutes bacterium]|nr:hypothetical protein [Mycoplasmatota bacterium]
MEKEPLSYLKLFEFIKEHGNESLLIFLEDYKHLEEKDLLNLFLFENNDLLKKLLKDNKKVIEFLRSLKTRLPIENKYFKENVEHSIENIDTYINNMKLLDSLNIDNIKFPDKRLIFTFKLIKHGNSIVNLNKQYSDIDVNYIVEDSLKLNQDNVSFRYELFNPNYIIDIKNDYINDTSNKTIYLTNLGTDLSTIPKLKELESKQVPETLTRHLKRISN